LPSHGTATALNLTHPVEVWKGALELGVGTPFSSRGGGENTDTIKRPTNVPTNNHRSDIIILIRVYCKMGDTGMTGVTGPSYIMTLDQLVQYHDITAESEATDKKSMNFIINPGTSGVQQNLIKWASAGFPRDYQVLSVALIHPTPCSDGVTRDILSYIHYLTGLNIVQLTTNFQSNFLGICFSYSISGNIVNLTASKPGTILNITESDNYTLTNQPPYLQSQIPFPE